MKVAICNEIFPDWNTQEIFQYISEIGYQGVEIAPFTYAPHVADIDEQMRQEIRTTAASCGLDVVGLHWLLVGPKGLHLTSPDPEVRGRTAEYLAELIDFCADTGGEVIIFGSPDQRTLPDGVDPKAGYRYAAEVFTACMDRAKKRGVTVCIEPLSPRETDFITRAEEAAGLCQMVDDPHFQMMVDCKAMSTEDIPMTTIIRENADRIRHIHLNDATGQGPGRGDTDIAPVITTLEEIGFDGYLSVEIFDDEGDPELAAKKSLEYIQGLF